HCTLGGMIGNNSCGVHSVMGGRTVDNVEELDILLYDGTRMTVGPTSADELQRIVAGGGRRGEIYSRLQQLIAANAERVRARYPKIPRRVSGYSLDELLPENGFQVAKALVGSESTCIVVLRAKVRLVPSPEHRTLLVLGFEDDATAGDHVPEVLTFKPIGLEGIDDKLVGYMKKKHLHPEDVKLLPEGKGWLLVEFGGGSQQEADAAARACEAAMKKTAKLQGSKLYDDLAERNQVWAIRESGLGATAFVPGEPVTWEGWEDSAVPPARVGDYLRALRKLLDKYKYGCALYGHFGDGCIHTRIDFDLQSAPGIAHYRAFVEEAADLVLSFGGSLSGEHGDGQSRGELLVKMFGEELISAFREFKSIWDPEWKMNPGKKIDPYKLDENLRLGADYDPWQPETHFQFPDDSNDFAHAALRCVGVGKCRRLEGAGTMCPSFMVTREEKNSTRGRAHLLFEMLQGEEITDRWRSEEVKDALDLCLSCKGCKGDCPVNVDIATYKAEFLSHYWEGRLRPRHAYAFGLINEWSHWASLAPGLVNLAASTPLVRDIGKKLAGMPRERAIPLFAPQTFKAWWRARAPRNLDRPPVVLFADTFNNYFHPEIARAGAEVLEAAGYRVIVPMEHLCCGRPLYDYGFLERAKSYLVRIFEHMRDYIRAGLPIVVLEPSCAAVFRDELPNLIPHDEDGRRLSKQVKLLSEFLENDAQWQPPRLERKALLHGHCHHKSLMKMTAEESLLKKMGVEFEAPETGCCGMAGSFGFEADKYDVSIAVGERVLLPAVRKAPLDTILIADGFSCQEQITQTTERHALHLAQVVQMALRDGDAPQLYPERPFIAARERAQRDSMRRAGFALAGAAAVAAGALFWLMRRR
ncbi:MAG TPA: FAD-linked oxidase C-terminal domain-containing protein, partial [Terriglobales bacterium]|nr:FAD-linked oxidase C-terminal domain-containing protein [Terriglobales bacterium]